MKHWSFQKSIPLKASKAFFPMIITLRLKLRDYSWSVCYGIIYQPVLPVKINLVFNILFVLRKCFYTFVQLLHSQPSRATHNSWYSYFSGLYLIQRLIEVLHCRTWIPYFQISKVYLLTTVNEFALSHEPKLRFKTAKYNCSFTNNEVERISLESQSQYSVFSTASRLKSL